VTSHRLVDARGAAVTKGDLDGAIAIGLLGFDLTDTVWRDLDHGDRDALPILSEQTGHAGFASNDSDRHDGVLSSA
jgi:hypothetical protein